MGSENNHAWNPQETCAVSDWTDNDKDHLEAATVLIGELARELPAAVVLGAVEMTCGVFYFPSVVLGHARRGLRDFRAELAKWKRPEPPV